jgi:protein SCO1/2
MDPEARAAVIKHQKIEGWMQAMTMAFPVKDEHEYQDLHPGDQIAATVFVQDLDFWIGEIRHEPLK